MPAKPRAGSGVRKSVSTCCRKDFILVVSVWQVLILPRAVLPLCRAAKASEARWNHLSRSHGLFYLFLRYSPAISLKIHALSSNQRH
jgi:hypothetical protein